jgi:hypothetical protein
MVIGTTADPAVHVHGRIDWPPREIDATRGKPDLSGTGLEPKREEHFEHGSLITDGLPEG